MSENKPDMNNIGKLLEQMVDHRQRVVLQVAGAPKEALLAVGWSEGSPLGHSLVKDKPGMDENTPPTSFLRTWMDEQAKKSFLFKSLYEDMTAWGKENRAREIQRINDLTLKNDKLHKAQMLERELARQALAWNSSDKEFLNTVDRQLIDTLTKSGYFEKTPHIVNRPLDVFSSSPSAISAHGAAGTAFMHTDKLGDFPSKLPTDSQDMAELAQQWASGQTPSNEEHTLNTYKRWFILLHEVSHCLYGVPQAPMDPTPGRIDQHTVEMMNRWVVGGLGTAGADAKALLNENHSDSYAAMLLMEITGHDPLAHKAIWDMIKQRDKDQALTDETLIIEHGGRPPEELILPDIHCSSWAMKRVMEESENWKGKPAKDLRSQAMRYASDGLLDFINPKREVDGKLVGAMAMERIMPRDISTTTMKSTIMWLAYSYVCSGNPEDWLKRQDKNTPAYEMMTASWEALKQPLQKLLAQELGDDIKAWPGATVADGVRVNHPLAMNKIGKLIDSLPLANNDVDGDVFKNTSEQSKRAGVELLDLLKRQLGVDMVENRDKTTLRTSCFFGHESQTQHFQRDIKP